MFFALDNIKSICGGTWIARPENELRRTPGGVCIDSRTLKAGDLFIAIKGDRTDGHLYIQQAIDGGAAAVLIDRDPATLAPAARPYPAHLAILRVSDTGQALLRLAAAYRKTLETTKVIAVGGSNGKTTTTRLIQAVLSTSMRGTASPKSFNNAIGVPLTILSARRGDQFLICEVGTNAPGEIATLTNVVQPDIAVITSIGREHLEGLGSVQGVINEEVSLLNTLQSGGCAIVNADPPELADAARAVLAAHPVAPPASLITFGSNGRADLRLTSVTMTTAGTTFTLNDRASYSIPLLGRHNAANAAAAVAVALRLGIDPISIAGGLASARGADMRLQTEAVETSREPVVFVNDAYNANPESMLASLRTFDELFPAKPARRRVLILGEMLELGAAAEAAHREIGAFVRELRAIDQVIAVGGNAAGYAEELRRQWTADRIVHVPELNAAALQTVATSLRPGDTVLLKGSRRVALERIIPAVRALHSAPAHHESKPAAIALDPLNR